ncbi:probable E3 ubiquitin-protein ligase RHB1A [Mercurialis annua]|uniref:probable E3 ubiquitin-protein ligase RHB1A n=1 Tax=Mercurialis annua TaxID=3986 RepID=UPI00215FD437|nr:probable E3 ubiquitin-protein ligase RHB1A [Mercurialis annua]XP_050230342.1 probable E3 ubiquitin-protein ligase RHB1A [Mercurialis annua]
MGGCCCCSSKGTEINSAPAYYYYPRAAEEHLPLSSRQSAVGFLSRGLLVDTNLDTSVPDAYRPPPPPIPFDVVIGHPQIPQGDQESSSLKNDRTAETTNSGSVQETADINTRVTSVKCEDMKESDTKAQTKLELYSEKELGVEVSKPVESLVSATEEEDCCPTCLEEYDAENPKITTLCEHHFHLSCILEWMERSDNCPVCDKEMIIDPPI